MLTRTAIEESAEVIKEVIGREVPMNDMQLMKVKLIDMVNLMALSAECKAEALRLLRESELHYLAESEHMGAMNQKRYIDASCASESALLTYCDRLNAGLTHGIDGIRTLLSTYKTELEKGFHDV